MDEDKVRDLIDCFYKENSQRIVFADMIPTLLVEYDQEFGKRTSLTKVDWCFLFVAIGLQLVRQYCLTSFPERKDDQAAAKEVKGDDKEHSNRKHRYYDPSLEEIITNPVPFDANVGSGGALKGGGSFGHRGATLGHDPLLGLVFGTANIATSTLTNISLNSFHIKTEVLKNGKKQDVFGKKADTSKVLNRTVDKILHEGVEGREKVATALVKEVVHLRSDIQSKKGLPLPLVTMFSPELSSFLAEYGVDWGNACVVTKQAAYATLINVIISMLHSVYGYIDKEDPKLFKVRTARILEYSNAVASIINLSVVAFTRDLKKLDIGGIAVAIFTIIKSEKFIRSVKEDFITGKIEEMAMMLKGGKKGVGLGMHPVNALGNSAMSKVLDSKFGKNVCKIARMAGRELRQDRDAVDRIRHEVLGDRMVFHCPRGWDSSFWQQKFLEYCQSKGEGLTGREIFLGFLAQVKSSVEKFKGGDKFDVMQIVRVQELLSLPPESLISQDGRDLEMTIDFLDLFGIKSWRSSGAKDQVVEVVLNWLCDARNKVRAAIGELCAANILILGRRGTGKSTVINLLLGSGFCNIRTRQNESVFEKILGTFKKNFQHESVRRGEVKFLNRHEGRANGVPIVVYDSIGIDEARREEWIEVLEQERERHNCRAKVSDWFHVIVYCIDVSEGKVDDLDVRAINAMIEDGNVVRVLLTKADRVKDSVIERVKRMVMEHMPKLESADILVIDARQGEGKELGEFVLDGYCKTMMNILPKRCCYLKHCGYFRDGGYFV